MTIATYEPTTAGSVDVISNEAAVAAFMSFSKAISTAATLPDGLRGKPADIFLAVMQGLDLGLRPMQAINLIDVIKGKPGLKPEGMRALILAAGHELEITEATAERCTIRGRRKGSDRWHEVTFTAEDAKTAGLGGDNWRKYTPDMLVARATSRLARRFFSDVTNGLPSTEDLRIIDAEPSRPSFADAVARRIEARPAADVRAEVLAAADEFGGADPDADPVAEVPGDDGMWPEAAVPGAGPQ